MTSREIVRNTIRFKGAPRLPVNFPVEYGYYTDFYGISMSPSPDWRRSSGVDEWGSVWNSVGNTNLGEVKEFPIKQWSDLTEEMIPDIDDEKRWECIKNARSHAGDKYIFASGISIYERVHFLRGLENTWVDIYEEPENLCRLLDILVEMNIKSIKRYAEEKVDGFIFCDDWGLQNSLMISPEKWRELWKPRYKKIYETAHEYGMDTWLHSCGYITEILGDLIEVGLDVIDMDQQENMGLKNLSEKFRGRLTFYSPADIQTILPTDNIELIKSYCRDMKKLLGTEKGGLIAKWYGDPVGAGHSKEAVCAMCDEFLVC